VDREGDGRAGVRTGAATATDGQARPLSPADARGHRLRRTALFVLVPLLVLVLCRGFVMEPFGIPSESMEPTLDPGDRVIANKLAYRFGSPHVGDVAVLNGPDGEVFAKRIVALGGARVEIRDGVLFVDRRPRREPYVDYSRVDGFFFGPARVPQGAVFVLGDNRGDSEDSRDFGPIPVDHLIGRVDVRIPSLSRLLG
jgi:signal peptidase I